ncbi:MAG TPA: M15 family metallopeptidase [Xanthobacteraceae bacterium]|nr:M15 family metallopeptidase [Xanthobacteraceae bacterium]
MRVRAWAGPAAAAGALALSLSQALAQAPLPENFVYLRDIDPSIAQDIRYASSNNFVGRPLDGYEAPECILRREVAAALSRVQADLKEAGLGLKVYDCYRPHRAVRAMAQWAHDGRADGAKRFFPNHEKNALFALGYLAGVSRHSTGAAVDVTLVELARPAAARFDPAARYAPCTAPAPARAPDDSVDMGTSYDCFDLNSRTRSPGIGAEAQRRRSLLVVAMGKHGFRNYHREWWHFSFALPQVPAHYDFPIRPRGAKAQRN